MTETVDPRTVLEAQATDEAIRLIRARLNAFAEEYPGPWVRDVYQVHDANGDMLADCEYANAAQFIADAPTDIALLLAEIDSLALELTNVREAYNRERRLTSELFANDED